MMMTFMNVHKWQLTQLFTNRKCQLREGRSGGSHFNATAAIGFGRNELRPSHLHLCQLPFVNNDVAPQPSILNP